MFEVREMLRLWLRGEGLRSIAGLAGMDRKTVRRYVEAAEEFGLDRDGGEGQLTDLLLGQRKCACAGTSPPQARSGVLESRRQADRGGPRMPIVGGLDVHRAQITFDWVDHESGESGRGRIAPATREEFRLWLAQLPARDGAFSVEATTGWRFVVEELGRAGFEPHLAEPAETSASRGKKRRAKTDRADARHLRELLEQSRLPESWIPPAHILDLRETVRLRHTLVDQRGEWQQRIHAILYHHGLPRPAGGLLAESNRQWLATVELPAASRQAVMVGLGQIDHLDAALEPINSWLRAYARRQAGCRAMIANHFGVGALTAPTILAELGDVRRFRNGDAVVRYTGLDITVYSSDGKRSPGQLARQGPPALRWALFEAATCAARRGSPDYDYYHQVKQRTGGKRPTLSVARKLVRRIRWTLIELGDQALAPVDLTDLPAAA